MRRLSETQADYAEFEKEITEILESSGRSQLEKFFFDQLDQKELFKDSLKKTFEDKTEKDINDIVESIYSKDLILPTKYDDPLSYAIAKNLISQVQDAAKKLGFDKSGYGGFGCAPTGYVNAMAIPVTFNSDKESRVFILFESGLLTFIDGIVRLTVASTPFDLLAEENPQQWNNAWDRHKKNIDFLEQLTQTSTDLKAWISFLTNHNNRKGLAFISMREMMPITLSVIKDMVHSAELFITAHEYVHAVMRHDDPSLDDAAVEEEADRLGALIAMTALSQSYNVNMYIALAGVALAIEAICINRKDNDPHKKPEERSRIFLNALDFEKEEEFFRATEIMALYRRIFHDLLKFPL